MRRYLGGGLLFILIGQASGVALANTSGDVHVTGLNLGSVIAPLLSAIEGSQIVAQLTGNGDRYTLMHMPMPHLARHERTSATAFPDVRTSRLATRVVVRGIPEAMHYPTRPPRERTRDPRAMHRAPSSASSLIPSQAGSSHRLPATGGPVERQTGQLASQVLAPQSSGAAITQQPPSAAQRPTLTRKTLSMGGKPAQNNPSPQILAASDAGAGINAYWTYQERAIPGVGTAMLNVGTGNLVVQTTDVDIPERGLDLAFTRTYNSQSLHDSNGDDGSEPSVFGNLWTNSYDAHIIFRYNGQNINAISVYDVDGTRCDYTPDGNGGWVPCAGQHAILEVDPSNSCSYWWIKKNGTAFWFHTDSLGSCNFAQANLGRVYAIYGRNSNNNITFNYSFSGPEKWTSEITQIVVNHSDAQSLTMNFAKFAGINELSTITYPMPGHSGQTATIRYNYDSAGDLLEVDKPGNDAAPNLSAYNVPAGDLPQTYGYTQPLQFLFACGPRATISLWQQSPNPAKDGACVHFDFDSSVRLTDWQVNGISNPQIGSGYLQPTQTGRTWGQIYIASFVYGTVNNPPCTGTSAGTTTMCDSDGHSAIWTTDPSLRVTRTQVATGDPNPGPSALVSTQTWDSNNNRVVLQSPQEFANGTATNVTYDTQGNVTKVQLPSISTSAGTLRPTATFTYDQFSNLTSACDPAYNAAHSGACPTTPGSGSVVFTYDTGNPDPTGAEPYGKLTASYSPLGYSTQFQYTYNGPNEPGDYGLPTQITGDQINQLDGSTPKPELDLSYDMYGNVTSYGKGLGNWTATYNDDNWPTAVTDPDNVTSHACYFEDGSISATQTALQFKKDGYSLCGANSVSYTHDTDGDVLTVAHHFNDNPGTTTKVYDGLDRLVEVDEPQGTEARYFYDITQNGGGSPNLTINGWGPQFSGFGNLYKLQRYFTIPGGQGNSWNDVSGNAFDAMGRDVKRFQRTPGSGVQFPGSMERWTTAYDASGQYGLLSTTTDPLGVTTTFSFDNAARLVSKSFSDGSTPNITYANDPDGRVQTATSSFSETYNYDGNGNLITYAEANQPNAMHPTISYGYYPNGWRKSLTINAGTLFNSNTPEFTYDYQKDGLRKTLAVAGKNNPFSWQYTPAGRLTSQSDPWTGDSINGTTYNLQAKSMAYDLSGSNPTGVLSTLTFPIGGVYSNFYHDAEGEVTSFAVAAPPAFTTQQNPSTYVTGAQIGYDNQGRFTSLAGTSPAVVQSGNGPYQNVITTTYQYGRPAGPAIDPYTGSAVQTEAPPGDCNQYNYSGVPYLTFDSAGRDVSTTTTTCNNNTTYTSNQRTYDAENHTTSDTSCVNASNGCSPSNGATENTYGWAPGGDLRTYSTQNSTTSNYRFHWDGSNLLFVTDGNGNLVQLNVEKLAVATYNPQTNLETGFVVYDRDFTGTYVDQHGKNGDSGLNVMPNYSKITNLKFGWPTTYLTGAFPAEGTAPMTPTFDMVRLDGYQVGQLTVQGARTYDPSIEQWTTPDAFKGTADSPASQWAYAWNAGNPITNSDPSGYDPSSVFWGVAWIIWTQLDILTLTAVAYASGYALGVGIGVITALIPIPGFALLGIAISTVGAEILSATAASLTFFFFEKYWGLPEMRESYNSLIAPPSAVTSEPGTWELWFAGTACSSGPGISGCTSSSASGWEWDVPDDVTPGDTLETGNISNIAATFGMGENPIEWASQDAYTQYYE